MVTVALRDQMPLVLHQGHRWYLDPETGILTVFSKEDNIVLQALSHNLVAVWKEN